MGLNGLNGLNRSPFPGPGATAAAVQPAQLPRRAQLSRAVPGGLHEAVPSLHHAAPACAPGSPGQAAHS